MKPRYLVAVSAMLVALAHPNVAAAQQVADTAFRPPIPNPTHQSATGPVVCLDHAHFNFHRIDGRYRPFAALLERDGYVVRPVERSLGPDVLTRCRVLVIANPLAERNRGDWSLPTPSAFSAGEIAAVGRWVDGGGALLLIADHMPFAGAVAELAVAFGARFNNGFTFDARPGDSGYMFRRADASLASHPVTAGRSDAERVDSVLGGVGSAFRTDADFQPLLVLGSTVTLRAPTRAWEFPAGTPQTNGAGWYQGAVRTFGRGRVAVFGEASMFTAQLQGPERRPMGMNTPRASQNTRLLLNLFGWLTGSGP